MTPFFEKLWNNYQKATPTAERVRNSLSLDNYEYFNDHVAFRSLNTKGNGIETLIKPFIKELNYHIEILSKFTDWIKEKMQNSKDDVSAACNDYLKALGLVAIAHAWIKVLEVCFKDYESNKKFYEDKIQTANFFFNRVLPRAEIHFKTATTGSNYIMNFKFN